MAKNHRMTNGSAYRKLWRWLRDQHRDCELCGMPIDYGLPAGDPWCFELDHKRPVSRWMEFGYSSPEEAALDPGNAQAAHRICNQRKGNGLKRSGRRSMRAAPSKARVIVNSRRWE